MKKQYVKPVMESEEFVATEYVAACSSVKCNYCSFDAIVGGPEYTDLDAYIVSNENKENEKIVRVYNAYYHSVNGNGWGGFVDYFVHTLNVKSAGNTST